MDAQNLAPTGRISRLVTIAISAVVLSLSGTLVFADEITPADAPAPSFGVSSSFSADVSGGGGSAGGAGGSLGE